MDFILAGATEVEARLAAFITGFAGIVASVGGVILTIRRVKSREQRAAHEQLKVVEGYLDDERIHRIEVEQELHQADLMLVQNGISPPIHKVHKKPVTDEPDLDTD